jgi:hypothetical protein
MKKIIPIILVLALLLLATTAHADRVFRCGSNLVHVGDTIYRVASLCGSPDFSHIASVTSTREMWVYDCGPGRLVKVLVFNNGRLINVRTERYGTAGGMPCSDYSEWKTRQRKVR